MLEPPETVREGDSLTACFAQTILVCPDGLSTVSAGASLREAVRPELKPAIHISNLDSAPVGLSEKLPGFGPIFCHACKLIVPAKADTTII